MPNEQNIFAVGTGTAPDSPVYGQAATSAWLTGGLRTDDGLDFTAEFDAQATARFGAGIAGGLARLQGDASAAAHAGVRLQAGLPLDLFEAAGIMARLRLEASANAQARVTASMTLAELNDIVLGQLPAELRPYARLVLEEAHIGATVWARASFAAMAVAEVTAVANLFPTDGKPAGVSAVFNYGFAWGYGGAWGVTTNYGFDTTILLRRVVDQVTVDLGKALAGYRRQAGIADDNPLAPLIDASLVVLPATLDALVTWCRSQRDAGSDTQQRTLGDAMLATLRRVLTDALLPRLLQTALNAIGADPAEDEVAVRNLWASVVRTVTAIRTAGGSGSPLEPVGAVATLIADAGALLDTPAAALIRRAVTCAAALTVLVADDTVTNTPSLRTLLNTRAGEPMKPAAVQVLLEQLGSVLAEEGVLPAWTVNLFGDVVRITTLLAGASTTTNRQAAEALSALLADVDQAFTDAGLWDHLSTVVAPELVRAIRAQVRLLIDVCTTLAAEQTIDAHRVRETVSVGILILIGRPVSEISKAIAGRGFEAVPPALRELADTIDGGDTGLDLNASWEDLARRAAGTTLGFPAAQLMRHVAHTTQQWMTTMLPGELALLDKYLLVDTLADRILEIGPRPAIAEFKQTLLPVIARHVVDHVLHSFEFLALDSVNLFTTMAQGTATHLLCTLETAAIVSFRLTEAAVVEAERAVAWLQDEEERLEREVERALGQFFTDVADLANRIRSLDTWISAEIAQWLMRQCLGPAAASVPGWLQSAVQGIVLGALHLFAGGAIGATQAATRALADTVQASGEALRIMAETEEGSIVGIEAVIRSLFRGDQMPNVEVPIGISLPNPILPWIWHYIEFTRVPIPANIIAAAVMTLLFDSVGAGPAVRALNGTAQALRDSKIALATIRRAITPGNAQKMRAALDAAKPTAQLRVEIVTPHPGAAAPAQGTITFRLYGADISFIDPQATALPAQAVQRVRIYLNGQQVPLSMVQWGHLGTHLQGDLAYSAYGTTFPTGVGVPSGPAAIFVLLAGGVEGGAAPAQASWHFIVEPAQTLTVNLEIKEIQWFPIAIRHPFVKMLHPHVQPLAGTTLTVQEFDAEPAVEVGQPPRSLARAAPAAQTRQTAPAARTMQTPQAASVPILVAQQSGALTRIIDPTENPNGANRV